jgi:hypothetical protein
VLFAWIAMLAQKWAVDVSGVPFFGGLSVIAAIGALAKKD